MEISPITRSIHLIYHPLHSYYGRTLLANDQDKILVLHSVRDWWIMYVRECLLGRKNKDLRLTTTDAQSRSLAMSLAPTPEIIPRKYHPMRFKTPGSYSRLFSSLHQYTWFWAGQSEPCTGSASPSYARRGQPRSLWPVTSCHYWCRLVVQV
jgi:hypothetical protein